MHSKLREIVDGRKLRFDVEVKEGDRTIGVGTHERRVVDAASVAERWCPATAGAALAYENLKFEQDGHVVTVTYDRPEQRNAVNRALNAELHDAWQRFRDDDDPHVLVITGTGEAFCAGLGPAGRGRDRARRLGRDPHAPPHLAGRVRLHAHGRTCSSR